MNNYSIPSQNIYECFECGRMFHTSMDMSMCFECAESEEFYEMD